MHLLLLFLLLPRLSTFRLRSKRKTRIRIRAQCPTGLQYTLGDLPVCEWRGGIGFSDALPPKDGLVFENIFGSRDDAEEAQVSLSGEYLVMKDTVIARKQKLIEGQVVHVQAKDDENITNSSHLVWISSHMPNLNAWLPFITVRSNFIKLGRAPLAWDLDEGFQLGQVFLSEFAHAVGATVFPTQIYDAVDHNFQGSQNASMAEAALKPVGQVAHVWKEMVVPGMLLRTAVMPFSVAGGMQAIAGLFGVHQILGIQIAAAVANPVIALTIAGAISVVQVGALTFGFWLSERKCRTTLQTLVYRVTCLRERLNLVPHYQQQAANFFKAKVTHECTPDQREQLVRVMHRANFAVRMLLRSVEAYAECLYPAPWRVYGRASAEDRLRWFWNRRDKILCFQAAHGLLEWVPQSNKNFLRPEWPKKKPGLLTLTLSTVVAYGRMSDELLQAPFYQGPIQEMSVDADEGTMQNKTRQGAQDTLANIKDQIMKKIEGADLGIIRFWTCALVVAMHRAFEMTFKRLRVAWKIYAQAYLPLVKSKTAEAALRGSIWPCKAFYSMNDEGAEEDGFCHNPIFTNRKGDHVEGGPPGDNKKRIRVHMKDIDKVCAAAKRQGSDSNESDGEISDSESNYESDSDSESNESD